MAPPSGVSTAAKAAATSWSKSGTGWTTSVSRTSEKTPTLVHVGGRCKVNSVFKNETTTAKEYECFTSPYTILRIIFRLFFSLSLSLYPDRCFFFWSALVGHIPLPGKAAKRSVLAGDHSRRMNCDGCHLNFFRRRGSSTKFAAHRQLFGFVGH